MARIATDEYILDIDWWQERDRTSIIVYADETHTKELWECWDENCQQLIEDGFIEWEDDNTVITYLESIGVL